MIRTNPRWPMGLQQPGWVTRSWHNVCTDMLRLELVHKDESTMMTIAYPRTREASEKAWAQVGVALNDLMRLSEVKERLLK